MPLTLWLVRHGQTESNAGGMFQGHLDILLNEQGIAQARATRRFFDGIELDAVYASDLQRAAATAAIIADGRWAVRHDPDLREMHYGILQGVRYDEAAPLLEAHGLAEHWRDGTFQRRGMAPPGGESLRQLRARSRRFTSRLDEQHPPELNHHVLIVAHGGKLGVLLTVLLDLPSRARHGFWFSNCGISRVTRDAEWSTLDLHNHVAWLDDGSTVPPARSDRRPDAGESHPRTP